MKTLQMLIPVFLLSTTMCKESNDPQQESPPFAVTQSNSTINARRSLCETQKNQGKLWVNERCIDEKELQIAREQCLEEQKIWYKNELKCISQDEADRISCEVGGSSKATTGSWIDGGCYYPSQDKPQICPDAQQAFDGQNCVSKSEPENFYRLCFRTNLPPNENQVIDYLKSISGSKLCKDAYSDLLEFTSLDLSSIRVQTLTPLRGLYHVKRLDLSNATLKDFSPLAHFQGLESLKIQSAQLKDIRFVSSLKDLKELDLAENQIESIAPIEDLKLLYELNLNNNPLNQPFNFKKLNQLSTFSYEKNNATVRAHIKQQLEPLCSQPSSPFLVNFCNPSL